MASRLPAVAALLCLLSYGKSLEIDKSDGGYKDLLISINKDVPYTETIVVNIKSLLKSSSHFLHRATNGLVYFKHVTINFPSTWPERSSARRLSSTMFEKSDVRIDLPPKSQKQARPFTKQSILCGKPGEYIQLAPTFLTELNDSTTKTFGNPAYVFVHEWAHYRYGVFDEHGGQDEEKYPRTYCEEDPATGLRMVKLNACSSKFHFDFRLDSGDSCPFNKTTCSFHEDCIVRIKTEVTDTVESSIMFMPYVANVSHFCDSTNGARHHNPYAPSEQNAISLGRSTWEIISENEDFNNLAQANMSKGIEVTFEETQHRDDLPPRVVLALDVSDRMNGDNRMTFLKEAATRYVRDIADGSRSLGIITFSSTAAVHHPLMPVNVSTRQSFLNAVKDLKAAGDTCIGCGLQLTLQVLNTTDETPQGGIILLMSDGEENMKPKLNDVLPELMAAKVGVSTMAMGASADYQIEKLATMTDGKAFFFPDLHRNTAILMQIAFEESTTGKDSVYIRIANFAKSFTTNLEEKFILESSLGNNTVVIFDQLNPSLTDVSVTLIDPSGQECKMCVEQGGKKTKRILIPSPAQDGEWTIRLESASLQEVEVNIQVKSQARDPNDKPIRVKSEIAMLQVAKPDDAVILAEINKGYKVILDARVVAEVIGPNSPHKSTVPLHDDGLGADLRSNDGIYSGFFVHFTGKGRYVVTVHVSGDERTRLGDPWTHYYPTNVIVESPDKSDPDDFRTAWPVDCSKPVDLPNEVRNQTSKPTGAFQRVVYVGSFQVTEDIVLSQVPPGRLRNFRVVEVRQGVNETLKVQLAWTWPGAHLTFGNASAVDIRASKDEAKIDKEFEKQERMTVADIVEGNLHPLPAGSHHEVTLVFSSKWATRQPSGSLSWTIFLAARLANSYGLKSDKSHVRWVVDWTPPATTTSTVATATTVATTTEVTTVTQPTATEGTTGGLWQLWVWFLIGGIAVVIMIAAVLVMLFRLRAGNDSLFTRRRDHQHSSDRVTYSQMT